MQTVNIVVVEVKVRFSRQYTPTALFQKDYP